MNRMGAFSMVESGPEFWENSKLSRSSRMALMNTSCLDFQRVYGSKFKVVWIVKDGLDQ